MRAHRTAQCVRRAHQRLALVAHDVLRFERDESPVRVRYPRFVGVGGLAGHSSSRSKHPGVIGPIKRATSRQPNIKSSGITSIAPFGVLTREPSRRLVTQDRGRGKATSRRYSGVLRTAALAASTATVPTISNVDIAAITGSGVVIVRWLWRSVRAGGSNQVARDAGVAAAATRDKARSLAQSFKDGFDRK